MRRLFTAVLGAAVLATPLAPLAAEASVPAAHPHSTFLTVDVGPCTYTGRASVRYQRVDGKPTSGVWRVTDRASCRAPQFELRVRGQLLHDGRIVKGFAPGGSCDGGRCLEVSGQGSLTVRKGIAGTWVLRLTMTVRGPDSARLAQQTGCVFSPRTATVTCSSDSEPLRIR